jgi:hypothetical protein
MDANPQPAIPPQQLPPREGGCRCCAMGCFSMIMIALLGVIILAASAWFICAKMVDSFTSSEPSAVQLEVPSDAQYATANDKLTAVRAASRDKQSVTVEFTAAEVNALIARHPDFSDLRGKFRVAMADSILTLDMSVPLRDVPLPRMKHRWLNGTGRFGMVYHEGNFNFDVHQLTANGREIPMRVLDTFGSAFNNSFNEGFDKTQRNNARTSEFWDNVKTLAILDDKLVVTTKGTRLEAEPSPTPSP